MFPVWLHHSKYLFLTDHHFELQSVEVVHRNALKSYAEQESPPAWTQEAYCLSCSKYFLCCPNWVPPWQGIPLARVPPPDRVPPQTGYPPSRVPPQQGTPPSRVSPWPGYPPPAGPGRVPPGCPMAFWEMLQSIMGYGYSPPVDKLTKWKYYLPVVLRTRAVITNFHVLLW